MNTVDNPAPDRPSDEFVILAAVLGLQKAVVELQKSLALAHERIERLEKVKSFQ